MSPAYAGARIEATRYGCALTQAVLVASAALDAAGETDVPCLLETALRALVGAWLGLGWHLAGTWPGIWPGIWPGFCRDLART